LQKLGLIDTLASDGTINLGDINMIMKSSLLYSTINVLSFVAIIGAAMEFVWATFSSTLQVQERQVLFRESLVLLVAAVILHALYDIGLRLMRVEDAQISLLRKLEK
jgi:hypothetical protein